ncbi:phospholipase/carboxylesterase [Fictibacillus macauensis ZFHKF-1]|uniref:Phospholipase/carboxylesterase n=1 Tax=Fictibacillus macauensis ZFHKF-1 TaxID=1196324 RepID=I8ANA0_9BACL|nr:alpha/beta hydrolase [Fictibacillus macauensis]EIT87259.1 phospholipase/carboxylesterase [Fictibacillus macauensis ZFHKF-1]
MQHLFKKGIDSTKPTLLLLHGTGGNEHDLLPLATAIDPAAAVLSVRGNILENGMPRFFKRLAEGVFDEEDLLFRTKELHTFLDEAAATYEFDRRNLFAVGYSNGANIAASLLFLYQPSLRGAMLFHPMVPFRGRKLVNLQHTPIFIGAGTNDPICTPDESLELHALLQAAEADVTLHWEQHGHQLTATEVQAAAMWYQKQQ